MKPLVGAIQTTVFVIYTQKEYKEIGESADSAVAQLTFFVYML